MDAPRPDNGDPQQFLEAPVVRALRSISLRALAGFCIVATTAIIPLVLGVDRPSGPLHLLTHSLVPIEWVLFAAVVGLLMVMRPSPPAPDAWEQAAEVAPDLAKFARRMCGLVTWGSLLALALVVAHHHLASPREVFVTIGILAPLTIAAWLLAAVVWDAWCRRTVSDAERESAKRLRRYWRDLSQAGTPAAPRGEG